MSRGPWGERLGGGSTRQRRTQEARCAQLQRMAPARHERPLHELERQEYLMVGESVDLMVGVW